MAILTIVEQHSYRGGTTDEKGIRKLSRGWTVNTDGDAEGEPQVIDAVVAFDPSAALFGEHPKYPPCICRELAADPGDKPRVWVVRARYSNEPFEARQDDPANATGQERPGLDQTHLTPADQRPPTITISRKEVTEPLEEDASTGDPVVNTVGDKFDPQPEVFRSHHLITWKFYRSARALDWPFRSAYMDSVNDAPVTVYGREYPAGTLRCVEVSPNPVWDTSDEGGLLAGLGLRQFFEITFQAEFNPKGWQPNILNTGRRKKELKPGLSSGDPDPWRIVWIVDDQGQQVADPVPLDEDGFVLDRANGAPFFYVEPDGYVPKDWSRILD